MLVKHTNAVQLSDSAAFHLAKAKQHQAAAQTHLEKAMQAATTPENPEKQVKAVALKTKETNKNKQRSERFMELKTRVSVGGVGVGGGSLAPATPRLVKVNVAAAARGPGGFSHFDKADVEEYRGWGANNLLGKRLTLIAIDTAGYMMWNKEKSEWQGFLKDLLDEVSWRSGMSYRLVEPQKKTGAYTSSISDVSDGLVDGAWTDHFITAHRQEKVVFSCPFLEKGDILVIKKSEGADLWAMMWQFLGPFAWTLWISILFCFVVVGSGIWYFERQVNDNDFPNRFKPFYVGIPRAFELSALQFTGLNGFTPKTREGRLLNMVFSIACLVFVSSYTAELAAHLTQSRIIHSVSSLHDAVLKNKEICMVKGMAATHALPKIYPTLNQVLVDTTDNAFKAVRSQLKDKDGNTISCDAVFVSESIAKIYLSKIENCDMEIVGVPTWTHSVAVAFKPSEFKVAQLISVHIAKLREESFISRLEDIWLNPPSALCHGESADGADERGLHHLTVLNVIGLFGSLMFTLVITCGMHLLCKSSIKDVQDDEKPEEPRWAKAFERHLKKTVKEKNKGDAQAQPTADPAGEA
jgi:hypothetical protein